MDTDYRLLLQAHTAAEEDRFRHIEELLEIHNDRLGSLEEVLHEINGGLKALKVLGWIVASIATSYVFFKEHIINLLK